MVNATVSEVGKNASTEGSSLLNQTGEVAKAIVGGAATVLGNISGEIKEGIGAKVVQLFHFLFLNFLFIFVRENFISSKFDPLLFAEQIE